MIVLVQLNNAVTKVMDAVMDLLRPEGDLLILIKPQFEAGKAQVAYE